MKRIMSAFLALMLTFSCTIVAQAEVTNNPSTSVTTSPREILSVTSDLQSIHSSGGVVIISIRYTYSYEPSNVTGKYITGIQYGTIKSWDGWHYVSNLNVNVLGTTYANNRQIAYIPVSYNAGLGSGTPFTVYDTLILSMYG